jgi:signal transduction histidine kinase/ActR/RegA family two-component response regulator
MAHIGNIEGASLLQTLVAHAAAMYAVTSGNGIRDPGMMIFPGVIILAAVLLRRRTAMVVAGMVDASAILIAILEWRGLLDKPESFLTGLEDVFIVGILLTTVTVLVLRLSGTMYRSMDRAVEKERSYRQIFDASDSALLVVEVETLVIKDANTKAKELLGLQDRASTRSLETILQDSHIQTSKPLRSLCATAEDSKHETCEASLTRDGGHLSSATEESRLLEISVYPAHIDGEARLLIAIWDITARRSMETKMLQGEKMRVVGQMASGIAHDFNNQLTGVFGGVSMLEMTMGERPEAKAPIALIKRSAMRSADLVRQLLAFARKGRRRQDTVDCGALIEEVVQLLTHSIDKSIRIDVHKCTPPCYTEGDATLLENAILNMALNARDAMPGGGVLSLKSSVVDIGPRDAQAVRPEVAPGKYVSIQVKDTGVGISDQDMPRLFEAFFTTKKAGHGMGLAAVEGAVLSHSGGIRVESKLGKGTRFEILLPFREPVAQPMASPTQEPIREADLLGVRVLVADDEPSIRRITQMVLQRMGCKSDLAIDGQQALDMFSQDPEAYDLVLLDHNMPGLSGMEVSRHVRAQNAYTPIILASGYGDPGVETDPISCRWLLPKPFTAQELMAAVRTALTKSQEHRTQTS